MKNLITLVTMIFSLSSFAQLMPKYLEGATVTVTLKNGETYTYASEKMAVVSRSSLGSLEVLKTSVATFQKKIENKEIVKNKKNRVYGLVGKGPTGELKVSTNGSQYETKHNKGQVLGFGYQRKLDETLNVGIQVQNNKTTSLSVGVDF